MLGPKQEAQGALFYEFSIDDHVPQDHLLRSIDRFVICRVFVHIWQNSIVTLDGHPLILNF